MKSTKGIFLVLLILFGYKCASPPKIILIKPNYCIVNDEYNEMSLDFKIKEDTVYFFYCNILDNGNYINGCFYSGEDSMDYAGSFRLADIKDSSIQFEIKSYRNYDIHYLLNLKFQNRGNTVIWSIDEPAVGYLPKGATFKSCDLKQENAKNK